MKKFLSRCAGRILPLSILFVVVMAALLYKNGIFIFPSDNFENSAQTEGISSDTDSSPDSGDVTDTPDTGGEDSAPSSDTPSTTPPSPPDTTEPPSSDTDDPIFSEMGMYESFSDMTPYLENGYKISYGDFGAQSTLAKITLADGIRTPSALYGQNKMSVLYTSALDDPDGIPYAVRTFVPDTSMALELYMGYIIIDNGTVISLFSSNGMPLGSFSRNYFMPAYTRDINSNPLFYLVGEGFDTYFRFDESLGYFVRSSYDDETDNRGLYFDYTPDYGLSDNGYLRFSTLLSYTKILPSDSKTAIDYLDRIKNPASTIPSPSGLERIFMYLPTPSGRYTFTDKTQKSIEFELIERRWSLGLSNYLLSDEYKSSPDEEKVAAVFKFLRLYNFKDGVCAGVSASGALGFFDTDGNAVIERDNKAYTPGDRKLLSSYVEPLYKGIESLGSLYFDEGYVRVRQVDVDFEFTDKMSGDHDLLIDKNGKAFSIPAGMKMISYSDGILLLQNSRGYYGYFSVIENKWIAQPEYTYARPFAEGLGVIGFENSKVGVIDREGKLIIPFKYDYISSMSSGVMALYGSDGWTLVAKLEAE